MSAANSAPGVGWQPFKAALCDCRPGAERNNCRHCEGTGVKIDFAQVRAATAHHRTAPVLKACIAYTKETNTPESDARARVPHVVELSDGTKREVVARDPLHALDIVEARLTRELLAKIDSDRKAVAS